MTKVTLNPKVYHKRRSTILDGIGKEAVAVIAAGPAENRMTIFRQTNDFYYLTGVETPHVYLLIDGRNRTSTLFLSQDSERNKEESLLSEESLKNVMEVSGIDNIEGTEKLAAFFERTAMIYTLFSEGAGSMTSWDSQIAGRNGRYSDPWDGTLDRFSHFIKLLRNRYPLAEIKDLSPLLDRMRGVKDDHEIELLRRAGKLTALGLNEAIRSTAPGLFEYQLGATIDYIYLNHGARGRSYTAILTSGANSWYGHYNKNNSILKDTGRLRPRLPILYQ